MRDQPLLTVNLYVQLNSWNKQMQLMSEDNTEYSDTDSNDTAATIIKCGMK